MAKSLKVEAEVQPVEGSKFIRAKAIEEMIALNPTDKPKIIAQKLNEKFPSEKPFDGQEVSNWKATHKGKASTTTTKKDESIFLRELDRAIDLLGKDGVISLVKGR